MRAIDKVFSYTVPEQWRAAVRVGTIVRVELHGRRVGGWVVALDDAAGDAAGRALKPLAKITGYGPPAELVDLAGWAAWRWAGPIAPFLRTASPPTAVRALPPPAAPVAPAAVPVAGDLTAEALDAGRAVVRLPPAADSFPFVLAAAARGDALVLAPTSHAAASIAARLRRAGRPVALLPREWARAAAGGCTVVGARAAAWAPCPALAAVVVVDEHDEAYQEERAPTWHGREVVAERASRAGVPCVLVSPVPSLDALAGGGRMLTLSRHDERQGWPVVDIVDRRRDDPALGLYSARLVDALRGGGRVLCVLNRKGRARLLACAACGELACCEACGASTEQGDGGLRCRRCGLERPVVCAACGGGRLKTLRAGVTRVREELEALAGEAVGEVTASTPEVPRTRVLVGTEAVLHRAGQADVVAFLDFDQELLAARYRAGEEAIALLVRAARCVGDRRGGGRVMVQTRVPRHEVLDAVLHGDPGRFTVVEAARRAALRLPPETAVARITGADAGDAVAELGGALGVEVLGPSEGAFLVRAPDHGTLCDALDRLPRPAGSWRIEVDPRRA